MNRLPMIALVVLAPTIVLAQNPWDIAKKTAGQATVGELEKQINTRLLEESRKNQCSFKTNSDQLMPGCDDKLKNLANALIEAKKQLNSAGVQNYKFEVSGHTDSTGKAEKNRELSNKRAAVIARELTTRGVPEGEIVSVGKGSDELLVKPDNTPAKKAQNRRYELRVRL